VIPVIALYNLNLLKFLQTNPSTSYFDSHLHVHSVSVSCASDICIPSFTQVNAVYSHQRHAKLTAAGTAPNKRFSCRMYCPHIPLGPRRPPSHKEIYETHLFPTLLPSSYCPTHPLVRWTLQGNIRSSAIQIFTSKHLQTEFTQKTNTPPIDEHSTFIVSADSDCAITCPP